MHEKKFKIVKERVVKCKMSTTKNTKPVDISVLSVYFGPYFFNVQHFDPSPILMVQHSDRHMHKTPALPNPFTYRAPAPPSPSFPSFPLLPPPSPPSPHSWWKNVKVQIERVIKISNNSTSFPQIAQSIILDSIGVNKQDDSKYCSKSWEAQLYYIRAWEEVYPRSRGCLFSPLMNGRHPRQGLSLLLWSYPWWFRAVLGCSACCFSVASLTMEWLRCRSALSASVSAEVLLAAHADRDS